LDFPHGEVKGAGNGKMRSPFFTPQPAIRFSPELRSV
jgi:hypothetical protein